MEELVRQDATLVATTPKQMAIAQEGMVVWAQTMALRVKEEASELSAALEIATRNRWGTRRVLGNQLNRSARRIVFYEKIVEALKAGYLVVPNFQMDIFAIRTKAKTPRGGWSRSNWAAHYRQVAGMLPSGEGQNLSSIPVLEQEVFMEKDKEVTHYRPIRFDEVDFPLEMAKPLVMMVTGEALARKLFDEVGIARDQAAGRRGDPMILGRLRNPRTSHPDVTFFVAWALDLSHI